jgi:peroxiredoxin
VELRERFQDVGDVSLVWVMADNQVNEKSLRFIDGLGLRDRVRFLVDPGSRSIDALGVRLPAPEPMEQGMPHPTTLVLDRQGVVRFADTRTDYHIWLDPSLALQALEKLP